MRTLLNQLFLLLLIAVINYSSVSYADNIKACRKSKDCVGLNHCGGNFYTLYIQSCCVDGWCKCKETNRYSPYCPDYEIETDDEFHYFCESFNHGPSIYEQELSSALAKCTSYLRRNKKKMNELVRDPYRILWWRMEVDKVYEK